jgi:hypothetical protein
VVPLLINNMESPDIIVKMDQLESNHNRIIEQEEGPKLVAIPKSAQPEPGAQPGPVQYESEKELDQL